jgi:hypothetical protein
MVEEREQVSRAEADSGTVILAIFSRHVSDSTGAAGGKGV